LEKRYSLFSLIASDEEKSFVTQNKSFNLINLLYICY
jgi:hypothetical protein